MRLGEDINVRDRPRNREKSVHTINQSFNARRETRLTIFPCLLAMMGEMLDDTASLEFQK